MSLLSPQRFICFHCFLMNDPGGNIQPLVKLNTAWCGSEIDFWEWKNREGDAGGADPPPSVSPFLTPHWFSWMFLPAAVGSYLSASSSWWRAAHPLADGCKPLGRLWVWMEFRGCGERLPEGKHTLSQALCLPLLLAQEIWH